MLHLVKHEPSARFVCNCETQAEMSLVEVGCKWNSKVPTDLSELLHPPWLKAKGRDSHFASSFSHLPLSRSLLEACRWSLYLQTLQNSGNKLTLKKTLTSRSMPRKSPSWVKLLIEEQKLRFEFTYKKTKNILPSPNTLAPKRKKLAGRSWWAACCWGGRKKLARISWGWTLCAPNDTSGSASKLQTGWYTHHNR